MGPQTGFLADPGADAYLGLYPQPGVSFDLGRAYQLAQVNIGYGIKPVYGVSDPASVVISVDGGPTFTNSNFDSSPSVNQYGDARTLTIDLTGYTGRYVHMDFYSLAQWPDAAWTSLNEIMFYGTPATTLYALPAKRDFWQPTAVTAVFSIPVSAATMLNDTTVLLTTSPLALGTSYVLTISNVRDLAGNPIPSNTHVAITMPVLNDITRAPYVAEAGGAINHMVVLEAVHYSANTSPAGDGINWVFTTTPAFLSPTDANTNFSSTGVMEAQPNNNVNRGTGNTTGPQLDYAVTFHTPGTYYVWVRGIADSAPGGSASDSVNLGMDGTCTTTLGNGTSFPQGAGFSWAGPANAIGGSGTIVVTTPGAHVINVWMREDGFDFDKLILTSRADYTPSGVGPSENPEEQTIVTPPTRSEVLVVEAEDYNHNTAGAGHSWAFTNSPPFLLSTSTNTNFSGTGCMMTLPDSGDAYNFNPYPEPGGVAGDPSKIIVGIPELDYKVYFANPGVYTVWVRGSGNSDIGGNSDSVNLGLDGVYAYRIEGGFTQAGGYVWGRTPTPGTASAVLTVPTAGLHVLNLWMLEDGFAVDKVILTSDFSYTPTGLGPAESPGPGITITPSGNNLLLTWPGGGILQSSTNVVGPYTDITGSSSPWPITPTGVQVYYRVRQ